MIPVDPLYLQQWHLFRLGNIQRIWDEYNGSGVHIGVYDTGIQYTHPDLDANYDLSRHLVIGGVTYDGAWVAGEEGHGTAVAGIIAAEANGQGTVGVAWGASLTSVNIFDPASALFINAADPTGFFAACAASGNFDVVNNSWGSFPENYFAAFANTNDPASFTAPVIAGWQAAVETGRGGLGTIVVKSSGNNNVNSNGEGLNASRYNITVAATGGSYAASYSNYGADVLVSALAAFETTDLLGTDGYNMVADPTGSYDYTDAFGGTSAAAPVVSGVVALMLDANTRLGWRDVQNILAATADYVGGVFGPDPQNRENDYWRNNGATNWNGGGMHYSEDYGYGTVDAYGAVRMAEVWTMFAPAQTSANEQHTHDVFTAPALQFIDATTARFVVTLGSDLLIEHVDVTLDFLAATFTDIRIKLVSPDGTEYMLLDGSIGDVTASAAGLTWTFGVDGLRGEHSAGDWWLDVSLNGQDWLTGAGLYDITFDVYGTTPSVDDVYHFTNEYDLITLVDPTRRFVTDTNGGIDWLDMAAVSGDVVLNLNDTAVSTLDGHQLLSITAGTIIERAVTGDGNDYLIGNSAANWLYGMRGNDVLDGGAGADRMVGGLGDDTYYVNVVGDRTIETSASGGIDTVISWVTRTLGANLENLTLAGDAAIDGTGNALANIIRGNNGANRLDGGAGADILNGGLGNDSYIVDNAGDTTVESSATGGTDRVFASVTYSIGANIEKLYLLGTGDIDGVGNSLANTIVGNVGKNILKGGAGGDLLNGREGNDTLIGGVGADSLVFDTALDAVNNVDRINGFVAVDDTIRLDSVIFAGLDTGATHTLAAGQFLAVAGGGGGTGGVPRITYDLANGNLYFDDATHDHVLFATLTGAPTITAADFVVYV